ncbi:hypothetical protein GQ53DRAFT_878117 [Thozetella sp. PMI_491]|nr:hypothetical protein GQ53DRAFT_878117 [Thozetella sp. PMI_491]
MLLRQSAASLLGVLALGVVGQHHAINASVFPSIQPSTELKWYNCYEPSPFKCARLLVPAKVLKNPKCRRTNSQEDTVALAIIKLPYVPAPGGPPRKGAVHVALGGWSSSSVNFLAQFGEDYAPLFVGYDLVAIDYRGWGWTTPSFRCFQDEAARQKFAASVPDLLGYSHKALEDRRTYNEELAEKCKKNGRNIGKYMGTYANAADHYAFMKASGDSKMSFWGVSSGTHLGQTIAALYPEAVDKFLFDSVVPSTLAYTVTAAQPSHIQGSERAIEAFFYTCLQSTDCAFKGSSKNTSDLRARFNSIDAAIKKKALDVPGFPKKFDWSTLHSFLSIAEHAPGYFPVLGGVLAEAEKRTPAGWIPYILANVTGVPPPTMDQILAGADAPFEGVLSGVAIDEVDHVKNNNDFRNYLESMLAAAPTVGSIFAEWRLIGQKWGIQQANWYSGPFGNVNLAPTGGKVVVLNNVADPASSISSAESVVARFSPSVLVKNNAAGHTTFGALSDCLFGVFYQFFVLDLMPAPGTRCGGIYPNMVPFGVQLPDTF